MHTSNKQWTFGIVTKHVEIFNNCIVANSDCFLNEIVESIKSLNIPQNSYEIIIIGDNNLKADLTIEENLHIIFFDESVKEGWITKKKNILVEQSKFENVILLHDYIKFNTDWYEGFQAFESDWDVCMVKILNADNTRWRDWLVWPHCPSYEHGYLIEHNKVMLAPNRLSYLDNRYINTEMYISGTVIIGKREFLKNNKLSENLCWGQGEDCEWSSRCRSFWNYKMNSNSTVHLLKMGQHSSLF
jgi:hypothetical protein